MRNSSKRRPSQIAELLRSGSGVRAVKLILCAALFAAAAVAQSSTSYRIDTVAGSRDVRDNGPATAAWLRSPRGVAADGAGNLFIADTVNHRIRKVDSAGVISTVAGTDSSGSRGDGGPAVDARLFSPQGVAVDGAGNLFIADTVNHRIRKVDSAGVISTVAGTGWTGSRGDGGPAVDARLNRPYGVAVDGAGNLFIADTDNNRIRKVDAAGVISTVAGTGEFGGGFSGDGGPATAALLDRPYGVAVDGAGNLFIADTVNYRIRKVDSAGVISTVAGTDDARLFSPQGVAVDGAGNLFIADTVNHRIRKVDSAGVISTVAGTGLFGFGFGGDGGPAIQAALDRPSGVAVDGAGNLFIADTDNHRIRKVNAAGVISTVAGTEERGDGGPAVDARLRNPSGVAADGTGNLFIADTDNHQIRKVDAAGTITTIAGSGETGFFGGAFGGDGGPAIQAALDRPSGVAADGAGNLFIADMDNHRIRKVDPAGVISTVAGTRGFGSGGDGGPAVDARLRNPSGVAVDGAGNLFIADMDNHRIRKVDSAGVISTVAGTGEFFGGFGGDGGPAIQADLDRPSGVAVDGAGNLFIADMGNHRIRKVDAAGTITTVAGAGEFGFGRGGFGGDGGPAIDARLNRPYGVAVDGAGNLFIADMGNHRIRKVDAAGVISTVAGTGVFGFGGDGGPADLAQLRGPSGVAVDGAGNLYIYIADSSNHRIQVLTPMTGDGTEEPGQPMTAPAPTAVLNAASFTPGAAPSSLQSLFGERLALETAVASELPLPEALGGVRIEIIDSTEAAHAVQLLYVSPGQINFLTPSEATPGAAVLRLTREGEEPVESALTISVAAPGLFSANGTGEGIGAITALRVAADGSRSTPAVFRFEAGGGRVVGVPLDLGDEGDRVFLTLFGTGIRGAGGATGVQTMIGDREVPVLFAGAQSGFAGLDQVNIGPLPRSLAGAGEINVVVTAAGTTSNTVTIVME